MSIKRSTLFLSAELYVCATYWSLERITMAHFVSLRTGIVFAGPCAAAHCTVYVINTEAVSVLWL